VVTPGVLCSFLAVVVTVQRPANAVHPGDGGYSSPNAGNCRPPPSWRVSLRYARLVEYVRLVLVTVNFTLFIVLGVLSVVRRRREPNFWVRRLWTIIALACGAVVVGSLQRLSIQAVAVGWLPGSVEEAVTGDVQLAQSLVVLGLISMAFVTMGELSAGREASRRLTDSLLERVRHVDPDKLRLTSRESEVLALIGEGVTTDSELAAQLHIAQSTVQSHVKRLLRETRLNRRTDLVAVAVLVQTAEERRSAQYQHPRRQ
jgi:DNA-binding CsgD family transcriptional regulator